MDKGVLGVVCDVSITVWVTWTQQRMPRGRGMAHCVITTKQTCVTCRCPSSLGLKRLVLGIFERGRPRTSNAGSFQAWQERGVGLL